MKMEFEGVRYKSKPELDLCSGCAFQGRIECPNEPCGPMQIIWVKSKNQPAPKPIVEDNPFIPWIGNRRPVKKGTLVDVRHRNGSKYHGVEAGISASMAEAWDIAYQPGDIMFWRLHEEYPCKSQ